MTARELIEKLQNLDPDTEVMIGNFQKYGSDFAYEIRDIQKDMMLSSFWGNDCTDVVFLIEGEQAGTMAKPDEYEDEEEE